MSKNGAFKLVVGIMLTICCLLLAAVNNYPDLVADLSDKLIADRHFFSGLLLLASLITIVVAIFVAALRNLFAWFSDDRSISVRRPPGDGRVALWVSLHFLALCLPNGLEYSLTARLSDIAASPIDDWVFKLIALPGDYAVCFMMETSLVRLVETIRITTFIVSVAHITRYVVCTIVQWPKISSPRRLAILILLSIVFVILVLIFVWSKAA